MIVVSGASGQLGGLTVKHLLDRVDASSVVALTRTPEKVTHLGVTVRQADFDDADSLARAFDGADRVLIVSTSAMGRRVRQHGAAVDAAARAGAGLLVYTSMLRAGEPGNVNPVLPEHRETERLLAESGMPYTVLRNAIYPEMLGMLLPLHQAAETGRLATSAAGTAYVNYVTRDDCAAAAAAVLAEGGYESETLDITGPAALGPQGVAEALSEATGRAVRHERVPVDDDRAALLSRLPPEVAASGHAVEGAIGFWREAAHGWYDVTTHAVERLTGRPPTALADHLRMAI